MSRSDEVRARVEAWNAAWNGSDSSALAAFFTDGATLYDSGLGADPKDARQGIVQVAEATWSAWPDARFEAVSITVEGDRAVLEWRADATHENGNACALQGVDVLELEGDLIRSARVYYDVHTRKAAAAG